MKILMVASECVPFVKVGGLADVVGTLPAYLRQLKHDIRIVIPKYARIDTAKFKLTPVPFRTLIPVGETMYQVKLWESRLGDPKTPAGGVPVYFIDNPFFNRPSIYGTPEGDYPDNRERFIFFCRSVMEVLKTIDFRPDIIHCHDWQAGLIPPYLKTVYNEEFYKDTASVFTIHNIAYQGFFPADTVDLAGFHRWDFTFDRLEYHKHFCFLKAGLVYSDAISTVSPTYAKEVQDNGEFGRGMEGILLQRTGDMFGILNGIDYSVWGPMKDKFIASKFNSKDISGKLKCKSDLQKSVGLPVVPNLPVLGAVSRLDPQKGYDLLVNLLPDLLNWDLQIVILGTGDKLIQQELKAFADKYPYKMKVINDFNDPLAHKIYAGSDIFLMPSRFEPCGLSQMIALAYGTIPVVNKTGGLADTITDFDAITGRGNGFVFRPAALYEFRMALERATSLYRNRPAWLRLMKNAFGSNFSWENSVQGYISLYNKALENKRGH